MTINDYDYDYTIYHYYYYHLSLSTNDYDYSLEMFGFCYEKHVSIDQFNTIKIVILML